METNDVNANNTDALATVFIYVMANMICGYIKLLLMMKVGLIE